MCRAKQLCTVKVMMYYYDIMQFNQWVYLNSSRDMCIVSNLCATLHAFGTEQLCCKLVSGFCQIAFCVINFCTILFDYYVIIN